MSRFVLEGPRPCKIFSFALIYYAEITGIHILKNFLKNFTGVVTISRNLILYCYILINCKSCQQGIHFSPFKFISILYLLY